MAATDAADCYPSVAGGPEVELRVQGSRFLARAGPAADREAAQAVVAAERRRSHDATHHCWGLRAGPPGEAREWGDDDGEPSGTAAAPILQALRAAGVSDAMVLVVRYFGGTKLGTGGLARAYGAAAKGAIAAAPRVEVVLVRTVDVDVSFEALGAVEAVIARWGGRILGVERTFDPGPRLGIRVLRSSAGELAEAVRDATRGRAPVSMGAPLILRR